MNVSSIFQNAKLINSSLLTFLPVVVENNNEMCSNEASLTCSAGSGIVQNALLLVLKCEKAKLHEDLNRVKKENARLVR